MFAATLLRSTRICVGFSVLIAVVTGALGAGRASAEVVYDNGPAAIPFAYAGYEVARANVAAGIAASDAALWGEARSYFEAAEKIRPSKELYKALSVLENKVSGDEEAVRGWLEKAADVSPERVWICRESGRIYDVWSPIALPQGSFNTIEWNFPLGEAAEDGETVLLTAASPQDLDDTLIEAPKVA